MKEKIFFIIILILWCVTAPAQSKPADGGIVIGVVVDGEWDLNQRVINDLEKELKDALSQQTAVTIPKDKIMVGDWTLKKVSELNEKLLADNEVDILIGYGVLASYDLVHRDNLPKPVIAPVIVDTLIQNVKSDNGTSGVKNLSYLIFPGTYERDIQLFREIVDFKNMIMLQSIYYRDLFKDMPISDESLGRKFGINIKSFIIKDDVRGFLNSIPENTDAVYIHVLPMSRDKFIELVRGLNEKRLPTFSFFGETDVRDGVMAGANPDIFPRLARRIALNIQRILLGEDAGSLSVYFSAAKRTFINLQTAFSVGVSPKWTTLLEADVLQMEPAMIEGAETYSLEDVIKKIGNDNLDVLAKIRETAASHQGIPIARANLFPQIDISATGLKIDSDRAFAGSQPENRIYGEASISQLIFSEPAIANLNIQSLLYEAKLNELEAFRQTTILDGSKLFINYLRTRKIFTIILENLRLVRANLEIAKNRESTGAAGPEEALRWEAAAAGLKKAVMDVQAQMNQTELALKQILNIPLIYLINVQEISRDDEKLLINRKNLERLLEDPVSYSLLVEYLVNFGLKKSADIQMLKRIVETNERSLTSTGLSRFLPTVSAFAAVTNTFYKSEIKSPFSLNLYPVPDGIPPEIPNYLGQVLSGFKIPRPDDLDWNAGISISLNLFNGMGTSARIEQSEVELEQIKLQLKSLEDKIALGIRSEMENLKAKYFGIEQSRIEVEAANNTLKIVKESYSRGALSILSLLDAQSTALNSQQVAANASYDLFISYMQLQRAIGQYDILLTDEEREAFIKNITDYISTSRRTE